MPGPDSPVMFSPAEMAAVAEDALAHKALNHPYRAFLLALSGGGYIALGFVFFTTSQIGTADALGYGVARVIGGLVFSVGLALVVLTGAELFTSTSMTLVARASGLITWPRLLMHWSIVYVGNFFGAATILALCWFGGTWHQADGRWGRVILETSMAKLEHPFIEAFVLGIACNLMVCLAVWVAFAGRTITDKVLAVTGPIALFVAAGFEHSIANMFMIPFGILIKDLAPAEYWAQIGAVQADYALLSWGQFFAGNLLPVTLGNIIGGGIMIGAYYWLIFRLGKKHQLAAS
jgi:formate transporter